MSIFLVGIFISSVAITMALQRIDHVGSNCYDCDLQSVRPNQSEAASSKFVCECCWRECDRDLEDVRTGKAQALANPHGSETDKLAIPESIPDVDAWLMVHLRHDDDLEWNMWTPILETVKAALEGHGAVVRIVRSNEIFTVIQSVKAAVAEGRRPLVFTVAHEFSRFLSHTLRWTMEAKKVGAYVVAYQAEPVGNDRDALRQVLHRAAGLGADEIWDYSFGNINHYPRRKNAPIIRYVPPGYVSRFDLGVDINSRFIKKSEIAYMGSDKMKTMYGKYQKLLGSSLHTTNAVWSMDELHTYLETYPLQLNQHRHQTCCPREKWEDESQHFESFRMSTMLANKACVLSAPSNIKDMKIWESMVTFVEVENISQVKKLLWRNITKCRMSSYEAYKREFSPDRILNQSGFFHMWRPPHGK